MLLHVQYVTFKAVKKLAVGVGLVCACNGLNAQMIRMHTQAQYGLRMSVTCQEGNELYTRFCRVRGSRGSGRFRAGLMTGLGGRRRGGSGLDRLGA